jgi:hypothetical protein
MEMLSTNSIVVLVVVSLDRLTLCRPCSGGTSFSKFAASPIR